MKLKSKLIKTLALALIAVFSSQTILYAAPTNSTIQTTSTPTYKWDLSEMFKSKADWEAALKKVETNYIPQLSSYKGKLSDAKTLASYLNLLEEASMLLENVYVYANLKSDLNTADNEASEMVAKAQSLSSKFSTAVSFESPELLSLSSEQLTKLLASPELSKYKHYLESMIEFKSHTLSAEEEALIATFSELKSTPDDIYSQASISDLVLPTIKDANGKDVQLTDGTYSLFLDDPNRTVRQNAFEGMFGAFNGIRNTLATTLSAEVKKNVVFAKARGYDSALEASLSQNHIPTSAYTSLVNAVNQNLDGLHKYVSLRKKLLGVDKVHYYDMYVPLVQTNINTNVNYEDAKKMVLEGLSPLGKTYTSDLEKALNSNWADVYESKNKYTGAYNWGTYTSHPYVLLNYNGSLSDVTTIAHEFGHAMNSYYTNKTQPYIYADTPIYTAEVASTTNEIIMTEYLIEHAKSDEEKLYLLNDYIENIRGTIYTQVMYAEFEKAIHEKVENGEALSADTLCSMWGDLMSKYYGEDFEVDELATLWWARIPHFYMDFYVYQYATGISAAYSLSRGILAGDQSKIDAYLDFLASGSSKYPLDTLKAAGVDMSSTQPVDELLTKFNALVDEMEQLMIKTGKIK